MLTLSVLNRLIVGSKHRPREVYTGIDLSRFVIADNGSYLCLATDKSNGKSTFECLICDEYVSGNESEMKIHIKSNHFPFVCKVCGAVKVTYSEQENCEFYHSIGMTWLEKSLETMQIHEKDETEMRKKFNTRDQRKKDLLPYTVDKRINWFNKSNKYH